MARRCSRYYREIACIMPQLVIRDVPSDVMAALERRASRYGRSVEAEHRAILEGAPRVGREAFRARAGRLRDNTSSRIAGESAPLIREDRASR